MSRRRAGSPLPDAASRRRAATDFEANLVIEAGAGTGKTSLLVERVLTAVGGAVLEITQLAAITFTEKAAGEMRQRLARELERLRVLARGEPRTWQEESEADRAFDYLTAQAGVELPLLARRALAALEQLDRAAIATIHSFCSELLRDHPVEARVDPDFSVDSGERESSLFEEAWEHFVALELGAQPTRPELWRELLGRISLGDIYQAARAMGGFGFPASLFDRSHDDAGRKELLGETAERLLVQTEGLLERAVNVTPKSKAYFTAMREALVALRDDGLEAYRRAIGDDADLQQRVAGKGPPQPNTKLAGVSGGEFKRLAGRLLMLARDLVAADDATIGLLLAALAPFVTGFREQCLRQGLVSFDGLLSLARDLLRDHTKIRERMKRRYRMLLVDEFQDTDPLQYEIVLFLAEREGGEARDAYAAELEPGRLFIVGDPKQSIYRFRGADYSAYRAAMKRVCARGGDQQDLVTNFRSLGGIVEPVNRLFRSKSGCAWIDSDQQPPYIPIRAFRTQRDAAPRVELWSLDVPAKALAPARRRAEGQVLAEQIERLVADNQVRGFGEISILLRSFSNVAVYLRALRERGVPFVVDGGREFLQRPEVIQLMATLQTLGQPADEAALLGYLRSPAAGVSDVELAAHAGAGGRWDWRSSTQIEGCERIAACFSELRDLARETCHLPADAAVRRVVERTRMLPLGAAAFEGAQRVANLGKLIAAAGVLARDGRLSLEEVVEALREGRMSGIETDSPLADDLAQAVRVSSIHGMKGLENRVIVLPDLARQDRAGRTDPVSARAVRSPFGRRLAAIRVGDLHGTAWAWLRQEDSLHELAEEVRVLYVALTRARDRLILLAAPSGGEAAWLDALAPWGYLRGDPPADGELLCEGQVLHKAVAASPAPRRETGKPVASDESAVEAYAEAVRHLQLSAKPPFVQPSGEDEIRRHEGSEVVEHGDVPPTPLQRDVGRAVGILIHRLLEHWDGGSADRLRESLRAACSAVATETGVEQAALEREASEIIDAFLASELVDRFRSVEIIDRELSMLLREEESVYRGSIDLLYRDRSGELVVADFKTDRDGQVEHMRAEYAEQLSIYSRAVQQALDLPAPPRAELWHLRTGLCIEL